MKRAQNLKPFISELLVCLFVIVVLLMGGMMTTDFISIKVYPTIISFLAIVCLAYWLVKYVASFLIRDFLAVLDAISCSYEKLHLEFVEQFPYRASSFTNVKGKDGRSKHISFYRVIAKDRFDTHTLVTAQYYELKPEQYIFVIAKRSKIIVDVLRLDNGSSVLTE